MRQTRGFTLIELLVVITIIVLLLALLAPALDKAIYQAELTVCGAGNQKSIASASLLYASAYRRQYPSNTIRRSGGYKHNILGIQNDPDADLRPVLRDYIPLKSWLDPFVPPLDLSREANGPATIVTASYNYWAGWSYSGEHAVSAMHKLGEKVGWRDNEASGYVQGPHDDKVSLIVSDLNDIHGNNNFVEMNHPDDKGFLQSEAHTDGITVAGPESRSWWYGAGGVPRGLVDLNFAFDDGSVLRYTSVTGDWINNDFEAADGTRFHGAPWHAGADVFAKRFVPVR